MVSLGYLPSMRFHRRHHHRLRGCRFSVKSLTLLIEPHQNGSIEKESIKTNFNVTARDWHFALLLQVNR